jgi:nucleoid DNA-binding protein
MVEPEHETGEAMSTKELKERVHSELGGSKAQADRVVSAFLDSIQEALASGRDIKLNNLGSFKLVRKNPRTIRHPQSGREIEVPGGRSVKFKPGKRLSDRIKSEPD